MGEQRDSYLKSTITCITVIKQGITFIICIVCMCIDVYIIFLLKHKEKITSISQLCLLNTAVNHVQENTASKQTPDESYPAEDKTMSNSITL